MLPIAKVVNPRLKPRASEVTLAGVSADAASPSAVLRKTEDGLRGGSV